MNDLSDKVFGRQRRRLLKEKDRRDDLQLMIYGNRNFLDLSGQALEKKNTPRIYYVHRMYEIYTTTVQVTNY